MNSTSRFLKWWAALCDGYYSLRVVQYYDYYTARSNIVHGAIYPMQERRQKRWERDKVRLPGIQRL